MSAFAASSDFVPLMIEIAPISKPVSAGMFRSIGLLLGGFFSVRMSCAQFGAPTNWP